MSDLQEASASSTLGVKVSGSAKTGHTFTVIRDHGLTEIFGTEDPQQASALLSHCLKVLNGAEAGDVGEATDERQDSRNALSAGDRDAPAGQRARSRDTRP